MELQKQVTNLELSKRLKDLGVQQESLFYWVYGYPVDVEAGRGEPTVIYNDTLSETISKAKNEHLSAFTVAELGEMLPYSFSPAIDASFYLSIEKEKYHGWQVSYKYINGIIWERQISTKLADGLAKMLIYLLENKLITP